MRNMAVGPDGRARMMYPEGQQLYGAHGQPLGQIPPPATSPYSDYVMPSPTGSYSSFTDDRAEPSRKRPQAEPHPSILPLLLLASHHIHARKGPEGQLLRMIFGCRPLRQPRVGKPARTTRLDPPRRPILDFAHRKTRAYLQCPEILHLGLHLESELIQCLWGTSWRSVPRRTSTRICLVDWIEKASSGDAV